MKLELKNVKIARNLSRETLAYTATVYVNGKRAVDVSNDGHGGCDMQHRVEGGEHTVEAINDWCKANLPALESEYFPDGIEQDLEMWCHEEAERRDLGKTVKAKLGRCIVLRDGDDLWAWNGINWEPSIGQHIETKYPRATVTMDDYKPTNLKLWTMPDSYFGAVWPATYVFLGQNRDSDSLTRSNFICALKAIGGESETVEVVRENDWAVGWVEWIAIHQDDSAALKIADSVMDSLAEYPVVNEDHWTELQCNESTEYWQSLSVRDRAEYCARAGVSIFAARRDYIPQNDGILDALMSPDAC
jgi:hypothetical protein